MAGQRLPSVTPRQVLAALERAGFEVVRQRGSHVVLRNPASGNSFAIAMHARTMKRGTLHGIIGQSGLTRSEFLKHL